MHTCELKNTYTPTHTKNILVIIGYKKEDADTLRDSEKE